VTLVASVYATLVRADEKQADAIKAVAVEVKHEIKQVAECKLDKKSFSKYKTEHQRANERMLDKFEREFTLVKQEVTLVKTQVSDSEKKIIRLLTIQEERRNNSGG
jgi:uncharacterized protein YggU (UPF0235/DUF167 family)